MPEPETTLTVKEGDRLLFYSAGCAKTTNAENRQLGHCELARMAVDAMPQGLFDMLNAVLGDNCRFRNGHVREDKALVVAEIR